MCHANWWQFLFCCFVLFAHISTVKPDRHLVIAMVTMATISAAVYNVCDTVLFIVCVFYCICRTRQAHIVNRYYALRRARTHTRTQALDFQFSMLILQLICICGDALLIIHRVHSFRVCTVHLCIVWLSISILIFYLFYRRTFKEKTQRLDKRTGVSFVIRLSYALLLIGTHILHICFWSDDTTQVTRFRFCLIFDAAAKNSSHESVCSTISIQIFMRHFGEA